jgi:hypothetical protein
MKYRIHRYIRNSFDCVNRNNLGVTTPASPAGGDVEGYTLG